MGLVFLSGLRAAYERSEHDSEPADVNYGVVS